MKKIYTIRRLPEQQAYMWENRSIEDEVSACEDRNITDYFFKHLPLGEPVLEGGCGLGAWVIYLKERGYSMEGIDHDERVISRLKKFRPGLPVMKGDICKLPYPDNHLSAYISLGVVEHFEEGPERPLTEAMRILRPGGIVLVTVPFNNLFRRLFTNPLRFLYLMAHRLRGGEISFAEYRYSEAEACRLLEDSGFEIVETDIDDFVPKNKSLSIWSEFPILQDRKQLYSLNKTGRLFAYILNSISRRLIASGILIIARKPFTACSPSEVRHH